MRRATWLPVRWTFAAGAENTPRPAWGWLPSFLMRTAAAALLVCSPCMAPADEHSSLQGHWQSDGYGLTVQVSGNELIVSEITDISCIEQARYRFQSAGDNRWYVGADIDPRDAMITIRRDPGPPERMHVRAAAAASEIVFVRIDSPPDVCAKQPPADQLDNFDVFWQTFSEHYPFFKLKQIDWPAQRERYRARLTAKSTDQQLYDTLVAMVEPLGDAHVHLQRPGMNDAYMGLRRDDYDTDGKEAFLARAQQAASVLEKKYFQGPVRHYAGGNVRFGRLAGNVGYLGISSFGEISEGSFFDQLQQYERELDAIFGEKMSGLVIDVRLNVGGSDILGQTIAARLATKPYVAYRKVARNDKRDPAVWTTPQPSHIQPKSPGFEGPVVILISRGTISAGETFTQALMGREPMVVRIGQNTQGVYSDVLRRKLPNGWIFGLPNELFLDEQGHHYDGVGIDPHHRVPVFDRQDLAAGRDPAVDKALEVLRSAVPPATKQSD